MGPLAAIAIGAGVLRTGAGIITANKRAKSDRNTIKRAYQISKRRLSEDQANTRQSVTESLNARGILNAGANTALAPSIAGAYKNAAGKKGGSEEWEQARMATDATRGQTGEAGTLSGQVGSDLSREFYSDHQDLFEQRRAAITATKRGHTDAVMGSIGAGIDVGTSVYNAGSMLKDAYGTKAPAAPTAPAASAPAIAPGSWFQGYDPVNPLGNLQLTNDQFNVKGTR